MKAPIAIRIVAGTREFSLPAKSASAARGSDTMKFTTTATMPSRAGTARFFGM